MPNDHTRNVSLTAVLSDFIRAHVASGRYRNASEVVRSGAAACERRQAAAKRTAQRKAAYARSA
jgi:putative addiction module CopG family antidote